MTRKTSPKMQLAKEWHAAGGLLDIAIRTAYKRNGDTTRRIEYRQHEGDEWSSFMDLTKYQAKAFVPPDMRPVLDELEAVRAELQHPTFGRRVDLNMRARTCARTKQLCDAWRDDAGTVRVASLMQPFAAPVASPVDVA